MHLFYLPDVNGNEVELPREEAFHATKVLRLRAGDPIRITDGRGTFYEAVLRTLDAKQASAQILSSAHIPLPESRLHLAIAPVKQNERFEWFLEKATEIGIFEITPLLCERSERRELKTERLQKILVSGMKQSLGAYLPLLHEPVSFRDFCRRTASEARCIAHCEPADKPHFFDIAKQHRQVQVCIGPEGDFSPAEIAFALENGFTPVSLGNSRLRTETAGIVAVHTFVLAQQR